MNIFIQTDFFSMLDNCWPQYDHPSSTSFLWKCKRVYVLLRTKFILKCDKSNRCIFLVKNYSHVCCMILDSSRLFIRKKNWRWCNCSWSNSLGVSQIWNGRSSALRSFVIWWSSILFARSRDYFTYVPWTGNH